MKKICAGVVISLILLSGSMAFAKGKNGNLCDTMTGTFKNQCTTSYDSGKAACIVTCKNDKGQNISNILTLALEGKIYSIKTGSNSRKGCSVRATRSFGCENGVLLCKTSQ
jgi:hypothetical protein